MGSRPLGIRAAGPPRGWPANFQNPGCAQGVSAPPLHPPSLSPAPSLRYLQGDLSHMAVSRCQGLGSTLGTTSTPSPATVSKMPVLLRPAPLTMLKATSWGFQATHVRPPSYLGVAGGGCLFSQKCPLSSHQLSQPLALRDRHPLAWLPWLSASLH